MEKAHHVGMADMVVVSAPESLVTLGLGSCIGLVLFDQAAKVAGMAHIMLPDSRGAGQKALEKPGKCADTAVPALIAEVCRKGAVRSRLKAKMAGGSQMFALPGPRPTFSRWAAGMPGRRRICSSSTEFPWQPWIREETREGPWNSPRKHGCSR